MMRWLRVILGCRVIGPRHTDGSDRADAVALRMLASLRRAKERHPGDPVIEREFRRMEQVIRDGGSR